MPRHVEIRSLGEHPSHFHEDALMSSSARFSYKTSLESGAMNLRSVSWSCESTQHHSGLRMDALTLATKSSGAINAVQDHPECLDVTSALPWLLVCMCHSVPFDLCSFPEEARGVGGGKQAAWMLRATPSCHNLGRLRPNLPTQDSAAELSAELHCYMDTLRFLAATSPTVPRPSAVTH